MQDPDQIVALSDGPANAFSGVWPSRRLREVGRAELWSFRASRPRASVLVCAGGGYVELVVDREGIDVATWLTGQGYDAHVLVHRLPGAPGPDGRAYPSDIALGDAMAALRHIRRDLPLFLMGLSSGGHLAGAVACQAGVDPAGLLIGYAPLNANHRAYKAPAGKPDYAPVEKQDFYDAWPIGLTAEPHGLPACPVFLAYALHDNPVPIEHALNFVRSGRDRGLDVDAHIFGRAPHGFALRDADGTHGVWPQLAQQWMSEKLTRFGRP